MKWDYATVVKWGLDQDGPDGVNLFTREVVALAKTLGADVEPGEKINGYQEAYNLVRGDDQELLIIGHHDPVCSPSASAPLPERPANQLSTFVRTSAASIALSAADQDGCGV